MRTTISDLAGAAALSAGLVAGAQLSTRELESLLRAELDKRYPQQRDTAEGTVAKSTSAYLEETFPHENFFVFTKDGQKFQQRYKLDLGKRQIAFVGDPKQVKQKYVKAYGTSEGVSKGWDTRGRGQNRHAAALKKAGFRYRGKSEGLHRYSTVRPNPKADSSFNKNLHHNVWVDQKSGKWAHESSINRTNMAHGRGNGSDSGSLKSYLSSSKFENTGSLSRSGPVWGRL